MLTALFEPITESVNHLLGIGQDDPAAWQIMVRALVIYLIGLLLLRSGAKRFIGKNTAFDVILGVIFGSVISRAINGSASFWGTVLAGATLVALHWLFGYLSFKLGDFGTFVKGSKRVLVEDGEIDWDAMESSSISRKDLMRALRSNGSIDDVSQVERATLERSGEITVLKKEPASKKKEPRILEVDVRDGVQKIRIELG